MMLDSPLQDTRPKNPLEVSPLVENFVIVPLAGSGIPEAPLDNHLYGRVNATWARAVAVAGDTMTGPLLLSGDPVAALGAVTKEYADATINGLQVKPTARVATAAALPANTYSNGTAGVGATLTASAVGVLTVDGVATALNDVVLVKNESASANNGLYTVTTAGTASVAYVLTRHTSMNTPAAFTGAFDAVASGTANANTMWLCNPAGTPVTIGSTAIAWTQINSPVSLTAGNGISISANTVSAVGTANQITVTAGGIGIAATYPGQSSIVTLGTVTTGNLNGVTAATQAPGNNTTLVATTAFVTAAVAAGGGGGGAPPSTTLPLMDGTAAVGTGTTYARADHVHPSDTTKVGEAPLGTTLYGRLNGAWSPVPAAPAPSTILPAMDGAAAIGASALYALADHVHPTDTSRAPLASPTFTGTVTIPAGASIVGYATTASVPVASTTTPVMDGVAAVGVGTTWARGDHVHPSDTSRAALAGAAFTGAVTVPTPTAGDNSTNAATTAFVTTALAGAGVTVSDTAPASPKLGQLWWDSVGAVLYVWYQDPTGAPQWVAADNSAGLPEAPTDGRAYGRQGSTASWLVIANNVLSVVEYTSSQTITIPGGVSSAFVQMWGATGGSGGVNNGGSTGTGAGGYLEKYLTGLVPGNTLVYAQGPAGTAGPSATAGGNGGVTTLAGGTQTIGTLTANGSTGSAGNSGGVASGAVGTSGGTANGGDVNVTGQSGISLTAAPGGVAIARGGNTFYSNGADGVTSGTALAGNPGNPGGLKIIWIMSAASAAPVNAGSLVASNVYSASQTITIPAGATKAKVKMWGATGGSGGGSSGVSGGTGSGGYLEKYLSGLTPGSTLVYTQGAAGTPGASTPTTGGNGGVTTLASGTQTIGTLTCNGSLGSSGASSGAPTAGTAGATASGGDVNITGQYGMGGVGGAVVGFYAPGGASNFSIGANGVNGTMAGNPGNPGGLMIDWIA